MKKLNLIKRLLSYSHEKQKPQRFGRYAAMLMMLLTLGVGQMWAYDPIDVYCAIDDATLGSYNLRCNYNGYGGADNRWIQCVMTNTGYTYNGKLLYKGTFTPDNAGADKLQFQLYNGNEWVSQEVPISSWKETGDFSGKINVYGENSWNTFGYDLYYVNTDNWAGNIYAYAWNSESDKNANWPGAQMTDTRKDVDGHDIYRVLVTKTYANIIFNNNNASKTSDLTLGAKTSSQVYNNGNWYPYPTWYWIIGNGAQNGSENFTKQVFQETATVGVYTLTRNITQGQTFHIGNGTYGYGPSSNTDVTGTSSDLALTQYGPVYWYTFISTSRSVIFTLNTNNMTLSLASVEEYAINYYDEGESAFSGVHGGGYPTTHTYGTATDLVSPTKTGYVFEGWYTNSSCSGDAVTSLGATAYNDAINLYAKWKALPIVYILKSKGANTRLPHGFTALADASKLTLWAWSTAAGTPNFYVSPKTTSYPGPSASEINDTYVDEFGDEWYRFIPNNTSDFNSSTNYGIIVSYDGSADGNKIYESNGTHQYCSDGENVTDCNSSTNNTYTGSVWIIPQGTPQGSAILYTENPATLLWSLYSDGSKVNDFEKIGEDTYQLTVLASAITNYGAVCFSYNGENYKLGNCSLHTEYYSQETAATLTQGPGNFNWTGSPTGQIILTIFKSNGDWKIYYTPSYRVTYDANGATTGIVPTDANYYTSGTPVTIEDNSGNLVKTGYNFAGWNGNASGTGTDYTPAGTFSISDNTTLYAKWTPKNFSITYKDQGDAEFSGEHASGYPTSHTYNTATTLKSASKFGYTFDGWFTSSACTGSAVTELGATDYTADIVLYAKWGENPSLTGLVLSTSLVTTGNTFTATPTIDAGDGRTTIVCWEVQTAAGVKLDPQPSISPEEGNAVTITAPAALGSYKVVATLREGSVCNSGTVLDTEEQSFTVEDHYTVTITNGSGSSSVGEVTTATATANPAAAGMKFDHWNVTGTISYTSGGANSSSITFNASSNIALTAVYVEDFSTGWYLATDAFDAGSWVAEKTEFLKRTGETAGSIAYVSYDLNRAGSYPSDNQFRFKIQDRNTSSTYGDNGAGTMTYGNCTDWSLVDASSKDVTKVNVNVTGTYTFKLDYANMKISVIYPVVNQLQVYTTTGTDGATIINDYDWTQTAGVYSQELELEEATIYTFKVVKNSVHYGNLTTLSASNKSATLTTGGGNISLTTTSAGTYTISYNPTTDQVSVSLNDESLTTVAVEYGWGGLTKNVTVGDFTYPTITATVPEGMNFDSWTHTGTVTYGSSTSTSTTITSATSGAKVTATFNSDNIIYFDNSASNWNDENGIWVYLFSSTYGVWYDDEVNGGVHPGVNRLEYGRMTRIGTSKIYYYKYSTNTTIAGVAFTKADQHNYTAFNGTSAAWLTSFNTCQPCYIASYVYTSKNGVGYHSTGYWKKYGTYDSGFSLWIYYNGQYHENKFTTTDPTSFVYTTSDELTSAGSAYNYHVTRCAGSNLRRKDYNGAIAASDSDYPRELIDNASDGTITTSSAGEYNFTLDLSGDHIYMYTEYPLTVGDYRVVLNNGTKDHPSGRIVRARSESVSDTVSFFINKDATNALHVDTCTSTYPSVVWETIKDVSASGLSLNRGPYTGTTGVYNFMITHSRYKDVSLDSITDEKKVYTGNYYIRTDAADGKWKTYITTPDNMMQHSAKSLNTEAQFDYYFTKYVLHDGNLQFTIANDYSPCISDTLYGDTYTGGADKSHQTLLADANVRYMWNSGTNVISRAYLDPATTEGSQFIKLHSSDGKLFLSSATNESHGDPLTSIVFTDTKNWIYQADVKALPNAVATLTAEYNDNNIDIISGGKAQKLFGGDSEDGVTLYPLRMVYDFKTNILVSAWIAETDQALGATNLTLDADLMIVRKLQEPAAQITFTTGSLSDVKTIYGALRFDYDDMVGQLSSWDFNYGKLIYDVSFPFDVNVKDIFGVGNMDDHWVVQKYNGARRAKDGWFMESKPFWETLTEDSVMHAYEGYTVIIDRPSFNSSTSVVWQNKLPGSSVYLYFPSASVDSKTISHGNVTIHLDSLNCKKDQWFTDPNTSQRLNHKFTDSNWRMLGVPLLSNERGNFSSLFKSLLNYTDENPFGYLYTWSTVDNSYSITSTSDFTFKAMHSYMVQFAGDVTFTGSYVHAPSPSNIVAAKRTEGERHYTVKLQMANANIDDVTSQTYVELRNNACDTFALNEDVYMVRSSNIADLYTFAGAYDVAANVLSVGNHVVPVGMDVKQAGMYTFSMPSDFSGTVTLVDTQAGTRTNLSLNSYEIYLNRGAINDRFYLDIDIQEVITSVENVEGSNAINDGGAHKFLQNGQMYILKNGVIYDAKGNRVK